MFHLYPLIQLEVLLRLKQASNAAFSFLSHEDPIHPYYVFLKSWGEAALALEYERRQRQQVDKRKEEKENAGAEEATTVTAKGPWEIGGMYISLW